MAGMSFFRLTTVTPLSFAFVLLLVIVNASSAPAQRQSTSYTPPISTAASSRAELEAEQQVSLSWDKIIELLRQEPGLLLEVKKMLVRKAYEQGRILDPEDLTDDALFQLLREDHNICVLATREIEDRSYIRAKPKRNESGNQTVQRQYGTVHPGSEPGAAAKNREDAYWLSHDEEPNRRAPGSPLLEAPQPSEPRIPENPTRQPGFAGLQPDGDPRDGVNIQEATGDAAGTTRITPDQLPSLLNASSSPTPVLSGRATIEGRTGLFSRESYTGGGLVGARLLPETLDSQSGNAGEEYVRSSNSLNSVKRPREGLSRQEPNLEQTLIRWRANPYANVPSLFDLYSQVSQRPAALEHFGMSIFRTAAENLDRLPIDLPAGPDYVLGPGDGLNIDIWGGVAQRLHRVVDPAGRIALPEVGTVEVSGRSLADVQHMVQAALRTQFNAVQADVSLARIRSIRVYVVGEVEAPGAYDISSLSTPLNGLYAARGPTSRGSLRHLRLYRGKELVQEVDAYDLLLHGVHQDLARIQSGDTIQVPPIGPQITVEGMVTHPAIYELSKEKTLAEALELAGGVLTSGTFRHLQVERVIAHQARTMLQFDIPESNDAQAINKALDEFEVRDGDSIRISPILPYSEKTIYLDGHVFHPGKYAFHEGMKLTDLIHSYNDLLPEPSRSHAEIIRLEPPDFRPVVAAFNLADAMAGKVNDLLLKPFDTVRIFGRYDFEDAPVVTLSGEVRDPGDHVTNGVIRVRDAIYLAGGITADAKLDDAQVFRRGQDGKLKVISVDLRKALADDPRENLLLEPKDRIFVHRNLGKFDPPAVVIQGEVARPGKYPLGEGMSTADLVRIAGGLKRGAYTETADLTRYELVKGSDVGGETIAVPIGRALAGEPDTDFRLHEGDVLTIKQVAGWNDIGASIAVKGEVTHPGTYGIQEGERLSSILLRAGGFRGDAYPYGVIFDRKQVRQLEEVNREHLIKQVRTDGANLALIPENDADQKMAKQAAVNQWQSALQKLEDSPPSGRLVIHISMEIKRWANTPADIQVRAGDAIYVPKKPNFVMVDGSVYNPTAVIFKPGKDGAWYLKQAGGPTNTANKRGIFVIRADGSVGGGAGSLFSGGVDRTALHPGDLVMVPEKAFSGTTKWKTTLESAQLAYAVGIAIQVARSF
ncbi:MAG: SLBB domain-containing protein [Acidobacteria bacterium]|nr:SLBB domain-containing protein [Acidobacteriota bacterium]